MKISNCMTNCPHRITADTSLDEALESMQLKGIRHLPVVDDGELIGVLSERDAKLTIAVCQEKGFCPQVSEICQKEPHLVHSDDDLSAVTSEMAEKKMDYALVADDSGAVIGIFTTTDALRLVSIMADERKLTH